MIKQGQSNDTKTHHVACNMGIFFLKSMGTDFQACHEVSL